MGSFAVGEEISVEVTNYHPPTFLPHRQSITGLSSKVTHDVAGGEAICLPCISTGATDSRFLRAGILPKGLGIWPKVLSGVWTTVHGKNERIDEEFALYGIFLEGLP